MKRIRLILPAVLMLIVGAVLLTDADNGAVEPVSLPEGAFIQRLFAAEDGLYSIRQSGSTAYVTAELSDPTVSYPLDGTLFSGLSDALWHEGTERLYYGDGCGIYHCNLTGAEKTLLWEIPEASKKDLAMLIASTDDCLLVKAAYREEWGNNDPNPFKVWHYYALEPRDGAVRHLFDARQQTEFLCADESNSYWVELLSSNDPISSTKEKEDAPDSLRVFSFDLHSGEKRELGTFENGGGLKNAGGVILDDTLHFLCGAAGIYSVPLSGGTVDYRYHGSTQPIGMDRPISKQIDLYDGKIYLLIQDGNDYPPTELCQWDPITGALLPADQADNAFSATAFYLRNGNYYLYAGDRFISGALS